MRHSQTPGSARAAFGGKTDHSGVPGHLCRGPAVNRRRRRALGYACAVLVLTRKVGEQVLIGEDIVVTVLDVKGDSIKIGFDAPRGIKIQRAEMLAAVTQANHEAAAAATEAAEAQLKALFPASPQPAAPGAPRA